MTSFGRAALAQIAAYGLSKGENVESIEARLADYSTSVGQADVDRAIAEGQLAVDLAGRLQHGAIGLQETALGPADIAANSLLRFMARFRIGPGGDDYRTAAGYLPAGATVAQVRAEAERVVGQIVRGVHGSPNGPYNVGEAEAVGSLDFMFVTVGG